jgi:hypothetical protein
VVELVYRTVGQAIQVLLGWPHHQKHVTRNPAHPEIASASRDEMLIIRIAEHDHDVQLVGVLDGRRDA